MRGDVRRYEEIPAGMRGDARRFDEIQEDTTLYEDMRGGARRYKEMRGDARRCEEIRRDTNGYEEIRGGFPCLGFHEGSNLF